MEKVGFCIEGLNQKGILIRLSKYWDEKQVRLNIRWKQGETSVEIKKTHKNKQSQPHRKTEYNKPTNDETLRSRNEGKIVSNLNTLHRKWSLEGEKLKTAALSGNVK